MPRNGSGVYSPPVGTYGVSGTPISSSAYDTFINDLSAEVTNSVNVQGTAPMLAALNMGTFAVTNAADPIAPTDLATKEYVDAAIPPGVIIAYAIDTGPPAGWLSADGSLLSTTTYANLFAVIGYTYGGSGANFNVPDFRGMFLRGFDNGRGSDFQGSRTPNAYQASYINNHFHAVSDPTHYHNIYDPTHTHGAYTGGHSHTATDSGHQHGSSLAKFVGSGGSFGLTSSPFNVITTSTDTGYANISISAVGNLGVGVYNAYTGINNTLGAYTGIAVGSVSSGNVNFIYTETTVQNYPVLWCIKY